MPNLLTLRKVRAGGPPVYNFKFEEGSAVSVAGGDTAQTIRIVPQQTWNNQWSWYAIRRECLSGQTPSFAIAKANHFNMVAGEWLACWATAKDTDTWTQMDNVVIGATDLTFNKAMEFPTAAIHIAQWPMYPFSRVERKIATWILDAKVISPASATNFIIGQATARYDTYKGSTAPALPFYALEIHSTRHAYARNIAILTAFNHPSETSGAFAFEGAVNWLLAGSAEAEFLLDYFDVFIYPCLNPQGLYDGYFRSCPQDPTLDHNRQWDTTGTLECIDAIKAAMATDTGTDIDVGIDFHSSAEADTVFGNCVNNAEANHAAFQTAMIALDAGFDLRNDNTAGMLRKLWVDDYSPVLSMSLEQGMTTARTITNWQGFGQNAMKSLRSMVSQGYFTNNPGIGSRDFNGTTDRIDWASVADLTGSPLTISCWCWFDVVANGQYIVNIGKNAGGGILLSNPGNVLSGSVQLFVDGATDMIHVSNAATVAIGQWYHLLVTWTGDLTNYANAKVYVNGIEVAYNAASSANGATEVAHTETWSLGGRVGDDTRNLNGKIAQVGVWNRILNATEIANLAIGYSPDLAAAANLIFYFKGNTVSLTAVPGGLGVADGTAEVTGVGNGPSIIYP